MDIIFDPKKGERGMKRLFSILFVVCAVCIFPKLSLAAGDGISCTTFCLGCDGCVDVLEGNCGCSSGQEPSPCELADDDLRGDCSAYSPDEWSDLGVTCTCVSSGGGNGGNNPGSGTSNKCTVRFCPNDNICPSDFLQGFGSSSHTSGDLLDTPSYDNLKDLGGYTQTNKFLKGWSRSIDEDANNILDPGVEVTISCNSNEEVFYYPKWGDCGSGTYASQGKCVSCSTGYKCPNGVQEACNNGYYQNEEGQSTCKTCLAGHYSLGGTYAVYACSEITGGHYCTSFNSDGGCNAIGDCSKGHYCTGGVKTPCTAGSYSNSTVAESCTPCEAGKYQGESGKSSCLVCGEGKYSTGGATSCTVCEHGYTSVCLNNDPKICSQCILCPVKHYCYQGGQDLVPSGYYATKCGENQNQNYECIGNTVSCTGCTWREICPKGKYCKDGRQYDVPNGSYAAVCNNSDGTGCTTYTPCPVGKYCTGGVQHNVQDGYYANECNSDGTGCTTYTQCPPGHYCTGGVKKACSAGTYSTGGVVASCTACPKGSYSDSSGATSCKPCESGKYQKNTNQSLCIDVPSGHYATGCGTNHNYVCDVNVNVADCTGCTGHNQCPNAETYFYCDKGQKLSCDENKSLGGCTDGHGCTECKACAPGETVDATWAGCEDCPRGYECSKGYKQPCEASKGKYQGSKGQVFCQDIPNGSYCDKQEETDGVCTSIANCKDYKYTNSTTGKISCQDVPAGSYAIGCSRSSPGTSCTGYETCPAVNETNGDYFYCTGGQKIACVAKYYLNTGDGGATSCTKCPEGTTFATTAVVGVDNCGLRTCLDYYNEAKGTVEEGVADWDEWYESWSRCSSDGPLAGCYMAPTKGINGALVDTGAGTKPKCCNPGTYGECHYPSNQKSCIAECTGCTGGSAQGDGCTAKEMKLIDKHTCPGVQTINPPSVCTATVSCTCRYNDNLTLCSEIMNNATNGDKVCYKNDDGKDRTNYCETFCYKECDTSPCTPQCGNITGKTGVRGCTDKEEKYPGRQFINDQSCKYYDNGVPGTAPNCSVNITCIENYHKPTITGCTPCLDGYHTSDGNTADTCTANTYYLVYYKNGGTGQDMVNSTYTYGIEYTLSPNTYTRTGYTFAGWATSVDGSVKYDDEAPVKNLTTEKNGIVNLYAKWTANNYSLKYDANGGTGDVMRSTTCTYDQPCTLSSNTYARTGYTFAGWAQSKTGSVEGATVKNLTDVKDGTVTLYAIWTANVFTVKFNINDGATGYADPQSKTCTYDQACTAATQGETMRKTDHVFKGWNTDKNGTGTSYAASGDIKNIISEGEITLYAIWKECDACDISSPGSNCSLTVDNNNTCTYTTSCDDGYSADGGVGTPAPICKANTYHAVYLCGYDGVTPEKEAATFKAEYTVDAKKNRGCKKPGSLFRGWKGKNKEETIEASYDQETETKFIWEQVGDIEFTAKWDACPKGYYCGNGIVEQNECPVGSTTGGGADNITQCFLSGGKSKICSNIDGVKKCFPLPEGVNVTYSGDWRPSAE